MIFASATKEWWSKLSYVENVTAFHVDLTREPVRETEAYCWLDETEVDRSCRFTRPGPRRRFILCRAALRAILCWELGCSNKELAFGASYYGKPYAIVQGRPHSIGFNVSHSGGHGLIGIASGRRVGVDVEEVDRRRKLELLADTAFTTDEIAEVNAAKGVQKHHLFFRLWTIKEALIKGVGIGLSLDMSSFEVPLALRRGDDDAVFRFPQAPSVNWRVKSISDGNFCGAIVHEMGRGVGSVGAGPESENPT